MEPNREPPKDTAAQGSMDAQVAAQKKWLVKLGNDLGALARGNAEWASQGRGLLEAARRENEPLVLLNLLRYQSARNKNWLKPTDVFTPLHAAMKECIDKAGEGGEELALELIRLLLVYTLRAHAYERKAGKEQETEP
jgi:hypothetical protein